MKTSSFVALIGSLAINGFNAFHQPAVAEQLAPSWYIAEAPSPVKLGTSETDNLTATQMAEKHGYKDERGHTAIEACFDNAYEFLDGLGAVRVDGK